MLRAALLELASALEAGADALTQTAEGTLDAATRMQMLGRASGYSEAASDIRATLDDYREGEER